jgi:hypothetical protein
MAQDRIPAASIQPPPSRALAVLSRRGTLDRLADPFASWRVPFRLTSDVLDGSQQEKNRALSVLRRMAPQGQWWAARLHASTDVWVAWHETLVATQSANPAVPPLTISTSASRWVIVDAPTQFLRVPRGMYEIEVPRRTLLR